MMLWVQIITAVLDFGFKAVTWAWENKGFLVSLGSAVFDFIAKIWGA